MERNIALFSAVKTMCYLFFIVLMLALFSYRNIPGIALYMTSLTQLRAYMAKSPYFALVGNHPDGKSTTKNTSALPTLTLEGNLIAGAMTRVTVGFVLNPFSVLKARYEVCFFRLQFNVQKHNIIFGSDLHRVISTITRVCLLHLHP